MDFKKVPSVKNDYINVKTEYDRLRPENNVLDALRKGLEECKKENLSCEKDLMEFYKLRLDSQITNKKLIEELDKVSLIMKSEELSSFDETTLNIAKRRKNIADMEYNLSLREINMELNLVNMKLESLKNKVYQMQKSINSANGFVHKTEKDIDDSCSQDVMRMKLQEYCQALDKLESELESLKVTDLQSHLISEKYKQYLEMLEEKVKVDKFLDKYHDLPPNILQAKVILEKKQRDYDQLENTFLLYNKKF
ncbi:uncharacterized protein LOC124947810 [Vespa velutina]|uniref:uncharacterized protein LOC124947810 n=1 Tax=Vespa velutina TaxID=202808 RepID=UPI001FB2F3ED|nr:uncharacterized protein LOC124947810 [Vespa velutina]